MLLLLKGHVEVMSSVRYRAFADRRMAGCESHFRDTGRRPVPQRVQGVLRRLRILARVPGRQLARAVGRPDPVLLGLVASHWP